MKLIYFDKHPNFGDALNLTMWPHLLPEGFLDDREDTLFLGVGSILWSWIPAEPRKIVVGSGYGGYSPPPDVKDGSWSFAWVRGPRTARTLGIDPELAVADSAILVRETPLPDPATNVGVAFMPHFESLARGDWRAVCAAAGVTFIDPVAPVDEVLAAIRGAKMLITEAMHGAIVADALRTPWIGVLPFHHAHREKWYDWAEALDIELAPMRVPPSSLQEAWAEKTGRSSTNPRARRLFTHPAARPANAALRYRAARALRRLAETGEPQLSPDASIERATDRAMTRLNEVVAIHA